MKPEAARQRVDKLEDVIRRQRDFLSRAPNPDSRDKAEEHLITLVQMRAACLEGRSVSADHHVWDGLRGSLENRVPT